MSRFLADLKYRAAVRDAKPRLRGRGRRYPGARDRRQHRDLQRRLLRPLLAPLAYPGADRIVLGGRDQRRRTRDAAVRPELSRHARAERTLAAFAEHSSWDASVAGGSEPVRAIRAVVSRDFFGALGVPPALGRAFADDEMRREELPPPSSPTSTGNAISPGRETSRASR
jgi:hypothetical protein